MDAKLSIRVFVVVTCAAIVSSRSLDPANITLLLPQGIRFEFQDITPSPLLVTLHYNVNKPLSAISPQEYHADIKRKTNGAWIYENKDMVLRVGDVVHYSAFAITGETTGSYLVDQTFNVTSVPQPTTTTTTTQRPTTAPSTRRPVIPDDPPQRLDLSEDRLNGQPLRLVFEDDFSGDHLDMAKWSFDVKFGSTVNEGAGEFTAYTPLSQNTYTRDGALYIKPTLTADKYGESFLRTRVWDLQREFSSCTGTDIQSECTRNGRHGILPPVMSGMIKAKTAITYGRVEIKAKMPRGDWLMAGFWMTPKQKLYGPYPRSGEMLISAVRGNRDFGGVGVDTTTSALQWGASMGTNRVDMTFGSKKIDFETLADGYHLYTMDWDETGIEFKLDGERVARFATPDGGWWNYGNLPGPSPWTNPDSPFDKAFNLGFGAAVGGTNGFFPDGLTNSGYPKPWSNSQRMPMDSFYLAKSHWYPTWKGEDAALVIDNVRIWQLL